MTRPDRHSRRSSTGGTKNDDRQAVVYQPDELIDVERAARRDHLGPAHGKERQREEPGRMTHRRHVDEPVTWMHGPDIDEVRREHREQIAVAQSGALRLTRGPGGIEIQASSADERLTGAIGGLSARRRS